MNTDRPNSRRLAFFFVFLAAVALFVPSGGLSVGGCDVLPVVDPQPVPGVGFEVLGVYESAHGLPVAFSSQATRDYLDAKAAKGSNGKPAIRFWDADADVTKEAEAWRKAMAEPRASLPWLVIRLAGRTVYSGPVPTDPKRLGHDKTDPVATLDLLRKYGGA